MRVALGLLLAVTTPGVGQSPLYLAARGGAGWEWQDYVFGSGFLLHSASQLAVPLTIGRLVGRRLYVDLTTNYARTRLESVDSNSVRLDGFTDTQLRASYTAGRDVAVFSLALNVPTGQATIMSDQLAILRSASQNFLPFPVSSYGAGFGVTGGVAIAQSFGDWKVGVAGSGRYFGDYVPFADIAGTYQPGLESRLRVGVLRSLGPSMNVTAGFTFSTFGTDEFTGTTGFSYRAGTRRIVELAVLRQLGRSSLQVAGWAYFRASGDSAGAEVLEARERLYYGEVRWQVPVGMRLGLDPGAEVRVWRPAQLRGGELYGLRMGARLAVSDHFTLAAALRAATGSIGTDLGQANLRGFGSTLFVRVGK